MKEQWKDISGFEGLYQVSSLGNIKSFHWGKSKKRKLTKNIVGYLHTNLRKNNKQKFYYIHRLVAQNFIPKPLGNLQINHINGIKADNRVKNLEWCTPKENMHHAYSNNLMNPAAGEDCHLSKLNEKQVRLIKHLKNCKPKMTQQEIGNLFNVSGSTIAYIFQNKIWKNIII